MGWARSVAVASVLVGGPEHDICERLSASWLPFVQNRRQFQCPGRFEGGEVDVEGWRQSGRTDVEGGGTAPNAQRPRLKWRGRVENGGEKRRRAHIPTRKRSNTSSTIISGPKTSAPRVRVALHAVKREKVPNLGYVVRLP